MEYITTKEASVKWGISTIRITILANEGRIPGAKRLGRSWLIPASAMKPAKLKSNHPTSVQEETDNFSFPLYHYRPDWNDVKNMTLSEQQQRVLAANIAVMECRFTDAYPILESILQSPDDIVTQIGCLWNAGLCCIALNKPDDFSRVFLQLQMLFSDEFPHRDDLVIILDALKTYVETLSFVANTKIYNTNIHDQCLPFVCMLIGYTQLSMEAMKPGAADTDMLELGLRLLQTTSAVAALEMGHLYLLGIYSMRQDMVAAERHAAAAVEIAYENKIYFPLVTYSRYNASVLSPIITQYPEEFQHLFHKLTSQYEANFTAFFSSLNDYTVISRLTDSDFPYIYAVMSDLSISQIAEKYGLHKQTVLYHLKKIYKKLGVKDKKELKEYLHNNM